MSTSLAAIAAVLICCAEPTPGPRIVGTMEIPEHSLARLRAEGVPPGAAVVWRIYPRAGVDRATTAPERLEFVAPPGVYEVEALVITRTDDGIEVQEAFNTVQFLRGETPPKPDPESEPKKWGTLDAPKALGKIRFGNSGCSATVVGPRRSDGRWDVLTAAHCMTGAGSRGTITMQNGKVYPIRVMVHEKTPDLAWCVTEDAVEHLPYALLAGANPAAGVKLWHAGYGVDRPGNREDGEVLGGPDSNGKIIMSLSVSSGDSGGGIFRADTNELISTVCCTAGMARKANVWGASTESIRKARPGAVRWDDMPADPCGPEWVPVTIPTRP